MSGELEIMFNITDYNYPILKSWYCAGLRAGRSRIRVPARAGTFSIHHRVQTDSESHPAPYPMGTRIFSLGVKRPVCEADHTPPSSTEVKECVEMHFPSSSTPSWCGAQFKHRDNFTFYLYIGIFSRY
jgi:hypothetical protein